MIRVVCTCGRAFKAEDRHAGKQATCPVCGTTLTIGPAAEPAPSRSGSGEGAAWNPADPAAWATATTRSGSDPGPDAGPGPAPPAAASGAVDIPPSKAPSGSGWTRAIVAGSAAVLVLVIGAFLWLRPATPGAGGAAPAPPAAGRQPAPPANPGGIGAPASSPATGADAVGRPGPSLPAGSRGLRLLVPAYIYPGGEGRKEWQRLLDAASKVEIIAIANPNSGPGGGRDLEYEAIFAEARNRGLAIVGYVSTDFGKRPPAEIKKDVDNWVKFYPRIRGIFLDQQPREGRHAALFAELRDHVRSRLEEPLVIANPGVPCDESYLSREVSDVTCVFVNYEGFERFELPPSFRAYDASRFAAMPYNVPDAEAMRAIVKEAVLKRIGSIYISDARPPNSWGRLPAYWEAEVEAVARFR